MKKEIPVVWIQRYVDTLIEFAGKLDPQSAMHAVVIYDYCPEKKKWLGVITRVEEREIVVLDVVSADTEQDCIAQLQAELEIQRWETRQ